MNTFGIKEGDNVKVKIYADPDKKTVIKTNNYDDIYNVYKKNGILGIDYDRNSSSAAKSADGFVPIDSFSPVTVVFEKVDGKMALISSLTKERLKSEYQELTRNYREEISGVNYILVKNSITDKRCAIELKKSEDTSWKNFFNTILVKLTEIDMGNIDDVHIVSCYILSPYSTPQSNCSKCV